MSLVPSSPIVYETLPLFLIAQTRMELIALGLFADVHFLLTLNLSIDTDTARWVAVSRATTVWLAYIPALVMVLRRPNVA
jgi:hypothetical protein